MSRLLAPLVAVLFFALGSRAQAVPVFSEQYGVSCAKCHSVIPHLNEFGAAFAVNGDRVPGLTAPAAVAAKINLIDSSEQQGNGPAGAGLPKAIVDEVELFLGGTAGSRASYYVEQYAVDGGQIGLLRDAWLTDRLNPWGAKIPLVLQAGSFTLPLPVDPETFRDTYTDYAPYVQTVGGNPFTFFDPKIGVRLGVGNPLRGTNVQLFAGPGHDGQSGLASTGIDTMAELQQNAGLLALTAFRYHGERPSLSGLTDRFERTGYGVVWDQWGRLASETVLIEGNDSACDVAAVGSCRSSGGFTQLRYRLNRRLFGELRYQGISDGSGIFERDGVALLGFAPDEHTRLTVEDDVSHAPQTTHTFNLQFTVAY